MFHQSANIPAFLGIRTNIVAEVTEGLGLGKFKEITITASLSLIVGLAGWWMGQAQAVAVMSERLATIQHQVETQAATISNLWTAARTQEETASQRVQKLNEDINKRLDQQESARNVIEDRRVDRFEILADKVNQISSDLRATSVTLDNLSRALGTPPPAPFPGGTPGRRQ